MAMAGTGRRLVRFGSPPTNYHPDLLAPNSQLRSPQPHAPCSMPHPGALRARCRFRKRWPSRPSLQSPLPRATAAHGL